MQKIEAQQQHLTFPSWLQKQVFQFSEKIRQAQVHEGAGFDKHIIINTLILVFLELNKATKAPTLHHACFQRCCVNSKLNITKLVLTMHRARQPRKVPSNPEVAAGLVLYRATTGLGGRSTLAHVGCQGSCEGEHWV